MLEHKILIDEDMSQAELAEKIGTSQGNLANKFKRNKSDSRKIFRN